MPRPTLRELERFLAGCLETDRYPAEEPCGIWREPAGRHGAEIARLGLALDPWPGLARWTCEERLDALWLHRPWRLEDGGADPLPAHLGVLTHHLAFDEHLTTGFNPRLAAALGLDAATLEPFGEKAGRPLGMIGQIMAAGFSGPAFARHAAGVFGGLDVDTISTRGMVGTADIRRIAVVGGMNEILVRAAAARGVQVYVTGQWRKPAEAAVRETGIGVLAIGHGRAERWGLRALAGLLRERWAGLEVRGKDEG